MPSHFIYLHITLLPVHDRLLTFKTVECDALNDLHIKPNLSIICLERLSAASRFATSTTGSRMMRSCSRGQNRNTVHLVNSLVHGASESIGLDDHAGIKPQNLSCLTTRDFGDKRT